MSIATELYQHASEINLQLQFAAGGERRETYLREALAAACKGMTVALESTELMRLFSEAAESQAGHLFGPPGPMRDAARQQILIGPYAGKEVSLEKAVHDFVAMEKSLLETLGAPSLLTEMVGDRLALLLLAPPESRLDRDHLGDLLKVKEYVCGTAPPVHVEHEHPLRQGLLHVGTSLAGGALILLNVTVLAATKGLSAFGSEVSKAGGSAMLVDGAKKAWASFQQAPRVDHVCKCNQSKT